jgi:CheY-like chemotaxis protein
MLRVLFADDCRNTAETFANLATAWGHHVEVAYDGASALALAQTSNPDVVLLDCLMPGLPGAEVARQLRAAGGPRPWLVAVTGLHPALLSSEDAASFDWRLDKPVEPRDLAALLQALEVAGKHRSAVLGPTPA